MLLVGDEESRKEEEWTKVQVEWPPVELDMLVITRLPVKYNWRRKFFKDLTLCRG